MKALYIFTFLLIAGSLNAQTTHNVEVGGGGGVTPYYAPQFITIEVGDIVEWNCVGGFHSVTSTSGPESFNFGPATGPWDFSFTFNQEGVWDYECTVGNHAETQFGTITVVQPISVTTLVDGSPMSFYPNPAQNILRFKGIEQQSMITVYAMNGDRILQSIMNASTGTMDISMISTGVYIVEIAVDGSVFRQRLAVTR